MFPRPWLAIVALTGCHLIGGTDGLFIVEEDDDDSGPGASAGGDAAGGDAGGGASPPTCDPATCGEKSSECRFWTCDTGECVERDKDLGAPCGDGSWYCNLAAECVECLQLNDCSGDTLCLDFQCHQGSCNDGYQSGTETDKDCGGSCPKCAHGMGCAAPSDCRSNLCLGNECVPCTSQDHCPGSSIYCDATGTGECQPTAGYLQPCVYDYECATGNCHNSYKVCTFTD